ncbi:putative 4-mercaptohistidine N1-methyltranferase [Prosthecobacter debontii]|uniref:Putative 4-mercaptohistidine N1-methyltranferase n=1 Tax=Prosthecobacter debontii TaxID=48467 RepID=A0A1T4X427_9BACT|nr:methyltransferase domain-containing protein [Prosthecobacter debontii]SKA84390.1 putative 4-mercaptohistidine N1-methyltranferase [Prosthecobacter debontii]
MNIYETRRLLDEYLLFHYGAPHEVLPWEEGPKSALGFAVRTVTELADLDKPIHIALDLGCAVGRSSFELAKHAESVVGIDYSHSFIEAATALTWNELSYLRLDEAAATTRLAAKVPVDCPCDRVKFEQGDAMHLREDLGSFDLVHAANLLCRLTDPALLISRLPDLVKPGGQLLLATPCTWLEEFTPKGHWPTGSTRDWLKQELATHFELDLEKNLPFLIREHARKYQWSVALGTRWIRK